jgi:hypothetical protein
MDYEYQRHLCGNGATTTPSVAQLTMDGDITTVGGDGGDDPTLSDPNMCLPFGHPHPRTSTSRRTIGTGHNDDNDCPTLADPERLSTLYSMNSQDDYDLSPRSQDGDDDDDPTLCDPRSRRFPTMLSRHHEEEDEDENDDDVMFSDEDTFDHHFDLDSQHLQTTEQAHYFTVHVPPGKLGLVIDTTNGGPPTVNKIHPTSVLVNEDIQIGDVLTTVDECPVAGMSASEVSQLIGSKANRPTRVLVFARR